MEKRDYQEALISHIASVQAHRELMAEHMRRQTMALERIADTLVTIARRYAPGKTI